jgi:two-component system chemotaxis response regulator CheB
MRPLPEDRIRIVVVDDSALFRHLIRDVLREIPGCSIVGNAENGLRALEQISERGPDLITLDVEMPDMNGIDVLRELKRRGDSTRAIMVSRLTDAGAQITTDALLEGAFDFILKPAGKSPTENRAVLQAALEEKIAAFRHSVKAQGARTEGEANIADETPSSGRCSVVLIGASTGGPEALREVLPKLPADFPVPVLVVQHMPPQYTTQLARRLNDMCPLEVHEAANHTPVCPGAVLIAPGGCHMKVISRKDDVVTRLTDDPPENSCRPAVDYLFRSAAEIWGSRTTGVILTGMGQDGTDGCRRVGERGGYVIAQSAEGCVVYGMPKSVIDNALSHRAIPLQSIASAIIRRVQHSK